MSAYDARRPLPPGFDGQEVGETVFYAVFAWLPQELRDRLCATRIGDGMRTIFLVDRLALSAFDWKETINNEIRLRVLETSELLGLPRGSGWTGELLRLSIEDPDFRAAMLLVLELSGVRRTVVYRHGDLTRHTIEGSWSRAVDLFLDRLRAQG